VEMLSKDNQIYLRKDGQTASLSWYQATNFSFPPMEFSSYNFVFPYDGAPPEARVPVSRFFSQRLQ
jgi:hypothetical protein